MIREGSTNQHSQQSPVVYPHNETQEGPSPVASPMFEPNPDISKAEYGFVLDLNLELLADYLAFFKMTSGTPEDYGDLAAEFRFSFIEKHGLTSEHGTWLENQLQVVRFVLDELSSIGNRYQPFSAAPPATAAETASAPLSPSFRCSGDPVDMPNNLPETDVVIFETFLEAINDENGGVVYDMHDTAPLRHWKKDMTLAQKRSIARQFLHGLKRMHGGHGPEDSVGGYTFSSRYDTIKSVLKTCKGSVYRMSRPSTLDDILSNPRKMRQRFIDNQINNAKKKKDGKELKRLREIHESIKSDGPSSGLIPSSSSPASPAPAAADIYALHPSGKRKRSRSSTAPPTQPHELGAGSPGAPVAGEGAGGHPVPAGLESIFAESGNGGDEHVQLSRSRAGGDIDSELHALQYFFRIPQDNIDDVGMEQEQQGRMDASDSTSDGGYKRAKITHHSDTSSASVEDGNSLAPDPFQSGPALASSMGSNDLILRYGNTLNPLGQEPEWDHFTDFSAE